MSKEEYLKIIEKFKEDNKEDYENHKLKKVFLDNLDKWSSGTNKGKIDWKLNIGKYIHFIYEDVEDFLILIDVIITKTRKTNLIFLYNKNILKSIYTGNFCRCEIGKLIGKRTINFKIEIGTRFQDEKRDITIIDRKYIQEKSEQLKKYYKYKCNKCRFDGGKHYSSRDKEYRDEFWITESNLLQGNGCVCCGKTSYIVVEGINDIPTTNPEMVKYFQGGYDEAKKFKTQSGEKIYPICPDCGRVKDKSIVISNIYNKHSIGCACNDSISYGEKYIFNILVQLDVDFKTQLNKSTLKWIKGNIRYDFYFEFKGEQIIIEVHGRQHYEESGGKFKMLKEEQSNDKYKKELALNNGIKPENYIIIDCRKSEPIWIKEHILDSSLAKLFDLYNINWNICSEYACNNLVKMACEYKRNDPNLTTTEIGQIMGGYHQTTIRRWLIKGKKLWCEYDPEIENYKNGKKISRSRIKQIICIQTGQIFESAKDLERKSIKIFNFNLGSKNISAICNNRGKTYKGLQFKFTSDLTGEQIKEIQENAKLNQVI